MVDFPASHFSLRGVTDIVLLRVGAGYPSNVKQHSQQRQRISRTYTPPKFNMEPKNNGFQKESPIQGCHFQVNHVNLWEG